jgi:UDP-N-acetylglucosamine--dolichyl-phosphate N-acetylglucosaminephosphotransferase
MITVLATILLGFADDMLELPWRYKLLFPFFIILPLVSVYHGPTHITLISPFSHLFGRTLDLGHLFLVYITLLGIYKTNTINIFAGINGL